MTRLPDTAGALPWFALGGLLSAFVGVGLVKKGAISGYRVTMRVNFVLE
jgi:flavin-binding protein dodecin